VGGDFVKKKHNFPRSASLLKMDFGWKMLARILPDPGPKHGPLAFFSGGHSWIFSGNVLPIENLRGKIGQNLPTLDTPDHWLRLDVLDVDRTIQIITRILKLEASTVVVPGMKVLHARVH